MAQKKGGRRRTSSHIGGDGKEYNSGVRLNAKMTPEMKRRLAKKKK